MSEQETIRAALGYIPAYDRDLWVRIGHTLKAELDDDGFNLWDEWSEQDDSYNNKDAREVWKSIKPNGRVTIDTLFYEARRNGYSGECSRQATNKNEDRQQKRAADNAQQEQQGAKTAAKATAIWKAAQPLGEDHPYLERKQIKPVSTLREIPVSTAKAILRYTPKCKDEPLTGRLIVVPVKVQERLSTLELIDEQGKKTALYGGAKGGGYWAAQPLPEGDGQGVTLPVGEGVATVLSAKQATGYPVVAALSCGNLERVANDMHARYAAATLVLLADLGNGQAKAEHAARSVGGLLAIPDFNGEQPEDATDFNDLAQQCGLEAVRTCIANAKPPAKDQDQDQPSANNALDSDAFKRLAALPPLEYDRCRQAEAERLGVRVGTLDAEVTRLRPQSDTGTESGAAVLFDES